MRTKFNVYLVLVGLALSILPLYLYAGTEVGNGGDAVYCKKSNLNNYEGYYVLDYFMNDDYSLKEYQSSEEAVETITSNLENKIPELGAELRSFVVSFNMRGERERDLSALFIWKKSKFGLRDIEDEDLLQLLPVNCSLKQVVIRIKEGRWVASYYYTEELIEQFGLSGQLSWLLIG